MKPYELHSLLGFRVTRMARLMEARFDRMLSPHGVTRQGWCVLRGIGREGVTCPSELAEYVCISRPAISRLLSRMEVGGLLLRHSPPGDRRSTVVKLTPQGERILALCSIEADALNEHFMAKLTAKDHRDLMRLTETLAEGETAVLTYL